MDLREQQLDHFHTVEIAGAPSVEIVSEHLDITGWTP